MSSSFGSVFRMYGMYIVMIVALAGIAIFLSDMNSAGFSDEELIKCLPNDTSCTLYNETALVPSSEGASAGIR